jgi:DNA-binding PadR family transcriptional regulator
LSPVFGHGRLRLYLLKLLEESPRHGYEVIRLLQDRFLGVYSPSPGTIYPRLARLEAEGLVSHEVVDGKKIYTLTDKGRQELERRMDELAELEEEIAASAQEFAREVQQDVRQTVRSLREELTQAARTMRGQGAHTARGQGADTARGQGAPTAQGQADAAKSAAQETGDAWKDATQETKEAWKGSAERQKEEWRRHADHWREQTQAWMEEWRRNWEDAWKAATGSHEDTARLSLERALQSFVEDVRTAAKDARLNDDDLADVQTLLQETRDRLRLEVFRRD